MINNEIMKDIP